MMKKKCGTTLVLIMLTLILVFSAIPTSAAGYTGWYQYKGAYYYLKENVPAKGWQKVNGKWYYLDPSTGAVRTGWVKSDGKYYYLNPSTGVLQTGWMKYNEKYYYLSPSTGIVQTGWQKISSTWYYFNKSSGPLEGYVIHHEATYKNVHHDATYETVHHEAVTESQWINGDTIICYCTTCWAEFYGTTEREAVKGWMQHSTETGHHGSDLRDNGHYEEVVVIPAWDETVCTSEAWDEQVVDTPAWDEYVTVG